MDEQEEFEFRARAEAEAAAQEPAQPAAPSTWDKVKSAGKSVGMGALRVIDRVSHFGQPQAAKDLVQRIATDPKDAPINPEQVGQKPTWWEAMGSVAPGQSMPTMPSGMDIRPAVSAAADIATSPINYIAPFLKIPYFAALARGNKLEEGVTALESGLTGKSMGALTQASTKPGREALHAAAMNQSQAARNLEEVASNAKAFMPEEEMVNEALSKAPDIDIRPTLKAFDKAMPQLTGDMSAATPGQLALRSKLQAYKAALQGKLPDEGAIAEMDFGGNLEAARAALADPQSKWGVLNEIAQKASRQASKAQIHAKATTEAERIFANRALSAKQSESEAAQAALQAKGAESDAVRSALAQKSSFEFPSGSSFETPSSVVASDAAKGAATASSEAGQAALKAAQAARTQLDRAKSAAAMAKEAYANAQAKAAVGSVTAQDAARAKAELDAATHNLHVADAANEVSQGKPLEDIARGLMDRHGLEGQPLSDALTKGRRFVADNSFTPAEVSPKISAVDFKRLREALDRDIDFNDPGYQSLKGALRIPRGQMKDALIQAAGPEYADNMRAWSEKIDDFNELRARLGKAPSLRLNRAELLLKSSHKEGNADLLERIDKHTGRGFAEQGRLLRLAEEFTEKARGGNVLNPQKAGLPSWRPRGGMPFASMEAGGIGSALHALGLPPPVIAALDAMAVASTTPAFATKIAIPAARHLPPAMFKALEAVPATALMNEETGAMPGNAIPFPYRNVADQDSLPPPLLQAMARGNR